MHAGKHPLARAYGAFIDKGQRRGPLYWFSDASWKGKWNLIGKAYGILGKYYGYGNAAVVRRLAGSGVGVQGSVGGWTLSSGTNNEQNLGGFCSISQTTNESAEFSFTGDSCGFAGVYFRSDLGGYAILGLDGDYTAPNGPFIQTITQGDINAGRFPSTFIGVDGTSRSSLNCKALNFRRATAFSEDVLAWQNTVYGASGSHTLQVVVTGTNLAADASGARVAFSALWASSPSQGTVLSQVATNGGSSEPQSTASSGPYCLAARTIYQPSAVANQNTKPIVGWASLVEDSVYEMANSANATSGTYYFNRQAHADGNASGPCECSHVPTYVMVASGTNNSGQPVINVRSGDAAGVANGDTIVALSRAIQVRTISSIAGDAITCTVNLTSPLNLNTASEKILRAETTVNGAVSASTSITLASSAHQIGAYDILVAVKDGNIPVCFAAAAISGTSLTSDRAVTIPNGAAIVRISQRGYDNYWLADNRWPLWLSPGGWWTCTDKLELRRTYTSSYAGEGTTVAVAGNRGDTTLTVTSDSSLNAGELVTIEAQGTQMRRAVSKAANVVTLDKPLDSYTHSGVRVARGMFWREDIVSWNSYDAWDMKVQWLEKEHHPGDAIKNGYDCMLTQGWAVPRIATPSHSITGVSATTPITVTDPNHPFRTGERVRITSNAAAAGDWRVTVTGTNTYTLDGSTANGAVSGGTCVEIPLTYAATFDSTAVLPLNASPVVQLNVDVPKTYNSGTTTTTNVANAEIGVLFSTQHNIIEAVRMGDVSEMRGTLWGTATLTIQNRATGDNPKLYFQISGSDGSSTERTLTATTIRQGTYYVQIREVPGFTAAVNRYYITQ
ncbi:hypothetical protein [Fimbriimonas ginsengisoli]|uniref:Uncharacterized protein n=1 Tax=Fimbriimonas ginsengisoli Gsoil 348 TaxID=661478 RepID=A0A068NPR1_FIMGI|nr:hypothetical protein [Fimbriimonas ginsengisoli]AIE83544.1 hypothetical protein OP10G_0176 [Fimbriimonas ginsengisoli Gsoil 348]